MCAIKNIGRSMSRAIEDLNQEARDKCKSFIAGCTAIGIDVIITCTKRTADEQAKLYAQGRTAPGNIVTNARPGQSKHETGNAFDFVPCRNGKPVWGYSTKDDASLWAKCGSVAESVGLTWSGRWTGKLKEMAHAQVGG